MVLSFVHALPTVKCKCVSVCACVDGCGDSETAQFCKHLVRVFLCVHVCCDGVYMCCVYILLACQNSLLIPTFSVLICASSRIMSNWKGVSIWFDKNLYTQQEHMIAALRQERWL